MSKITVFVDQSFDRPTREALGRAIIEYIVDRARKGQGKDKKPMGGPDGDNKYSPNYTKTPEFKATGKRKGRVNMTLTGDMLDDLEVVDSSLAGRIVIDAEQSENKNKINYLKDKGYDFMALSKEEVSRISSRFDRSTVSTVNISRGIAQSLLRRVLGDG